MYIMALNTWLLDNSLDKRPDRKLYIFFSSERDSTVQYSTVQYGTVRYSSVQLNSAQ